MMLNLSKRSLSSKKGRRLRSQILVIKRRIKNLKSVKIERGRKQLMKLCIPNHDLIKSYVHMLN